VLKGIFVSDKKTTKRDLVVLIQQKTPERRTSLPFALFLIGYSLRQAGFRTYLFDHRFENISTLKSKLRNPSILFCGFSLMTGPIIKQSLYLADMIKEIRPDLPIVFGGPHPTILPEQTVSHPLVDIVCIGEGEETSIELAKALQCGSSLEDINGIALKRNHSPLLTSSKNNFYDFANGASYDLSTIPLDRYIFLNKGKRSAHIITSRGCPFKCAFCWNAIYCKGRYSSWNVDKIKQEIMPLIDSGAERIIFWESFLGSERRILEIADLMRELGVSWAIEDGFHVRAHNSDKIFSALRKTDCDTVAFGAESGNQKMLDFLRKDISVEHIREAARKTAKYGLGARFQWMMGIPTQTRENALETIDLIREIDSINQLSAHTMEMFIPYPGSEIYEYVLGVGWQAPKRLDD